MADRWWNGRRRREGWARILAIDPGQVTATTAPSLEDRYRAAEAALPFNHTGAVTHATPTVHWTPGDDCLLLRTGSRGWEITAVDGTDGRIRTVLTGADAARRIGAAGGAGVPVHQARVRAGDTAAHVHGDATCWEVPYDGGPALECGEPLDGVVSPDGRCKVYARDHDLLLWDFASGTSRPLTVDGTASAPYGLQPDTGRMTLLHRQLGRRPDPVVVWSPDSTWLATHILDQVGVETMTLVESTPSAEDRPVAHTFAYSVPGDPVVPTARLVLIEVAEAGDTVVHPEAYAAPHHAPEADGRCWWQGTACYYLVVSRDHHDVELHRLEARTGAHGVVHREHSDTWIDLGPNPTEPPLVRVLRSGEFVWYSSADTDGSLYLHDLGTGARIRRLGTAEQLPVTILSVDEVARSVLVVVSGCTPDLYARQLARIDLDTGASELLTVDGLDHRLRASPGGRRLLDVASDPATTPTVVVRDGRGAVTAAVPDVDGGIAWEPPWCRPPERVGFVAADGITPILGTLHFPMGFDPDRRYPVVDYLYPGPQIGVASPAHWSVAPRIEHALAALGFVVLTLDGRGTPGRGRRFHHAQYQATQKAGYLEDHVAALAQLAGSHPFADTTRVAAIGHSGGGYAAFRALAVYPDTFIAAVATAGDHDQRFYTSQWLERWHAADASTYAGIDNASLAGRVRGPVLLVHGELDDNVPPTQTLRLVDALIDADKDFELLIVPGVDHSLAGREGYVARRSWDFLVTHLLDEPATPTRAVTEPAPEHYWRRL